MSVRDEGGDRGRVAVVRARDSEEAAARKAIRALKTPASERPLDATGLARFLARPQNVLLVAWWEGECRRGWRRVSSLRWRTGFRQGAGVAEPPSGGLSATRMETNQ